MPTTTITATAVVVTSPTEPVEVVSIEVQPPGDGEVRVAMRASGVCHSDLHARTGAWTTPMPAVLGHEGAGVVEAVGPGVTDLEVGDHVILAWVAPCGRCERCAKGFGWACQKANDFEFSADEARLHRDGVALAPYLGVGTYSTHTVVPQTAAVRIPTDVPFEVAALISCAVTTGVGAVTHNADVSAGDSVLVIGCGGVGLSAVMAARMVGAAPVVALDVDENALELARQLGATHTYTPEEPDAWQAWCPDGFDRVIDAVGRPVTMASALEALAPAGKVVLVGMPPEGTELTIDPLSLAVQGQSLIGSNFGATVPLVDFPRLCRMFAAGQLPIDQLVTRRVELDGAGAALEALGRGGAVGRSVIVMQL